MQLKFLFFLFVKPTHFACRAVPIDSFAAIQVELEKISQLGNLWLLFGHHEISIWKKNYLFNKMKSRVNFQSSSLYKIICIFTSEVFVIRGCWSGLMSSGRRRLVVTNSGLEISATLNENVAFFVQQIASSEFSPLMIKLKAIVVYENNFDSVRMIQHNKINLPISFKHIVQFFLI